ncbi:MAG TPA: 2-oxoglutarate dehydrogenase, E2 component, dihydrolipoamide succinyltransferase [Jatrophihabitantaceae bacterium]|nr:2-oxoglutarate dehydrogenase, E2 component, dihydrolipoamide succinyltransferase [Jatrophihabitantaceae bacterium]
MPRLGESVTEGTVTRWLKSEGDHVDADEPLLEVSTDKVDTEVPSPASGVLTSIKVHEDETVEIGVELAVIGDDGASAAPAAPAGRAYAEQPRAEQPPAPQPYPEQPPAPQAPPSAQPYADQPFGDQPFAAPPAPAPVQAAPPPQQAAPAPQAPAPQAPAPQAPAPAPQPYAFTPPAQPQQQEAPAPQQAPPAPVANDAAPAPAPAEEAQVESAEDDDLAGTYVTPLVRKLASEHGVDLTAIVGTGVGGRIRKSDVLAAAERAAQEAAEQAEALTAAAAAPAPPVADSAPAASAPPAVRGHVEKMSRLRQTIASRMVESLQTSAQLTTVVEVDVTRIARLRDRAKADFEAREGVKLSFLPFFAVAAVEALKAHPSVNSSVDTEQKTITYHDAEHLGIAVDTERGLLVPVIHNAGDLNLTGLARQIADLAERTRTNKISPDELSGGTFTLTNTGSRGALFDTPIINQPQVAILGTGAVVKRPLVVSDDNFGETIAIRSMVYLALTYDHRVVDGADAARFLGTLKARLEAGTFERALGLDWPG